MINIDHQVARVRLQTRSSKIPLCKAKMATLTDRYFEVSDTTVNVSAVHFASLRWQRWPAIKTKKSRKTGADLAADQGKKEMALASGDFESAGRPFGL
jgi:hypothetical protein